MTGLYITGHPLDDYAKSLKIQTTNEIAEVFSEEETLDMNETDELLGNVQIFNKEKAIQDNDRVILGGILAKVNQKITRNNSIMAFLTLEDLSGDIEVIVFPKTYNEYRSSIFVDNKVFIAGDVDQKDDENGKIRCNRIIPFDSVPKEVWIKFKNKQAYIDAEKNLFNIIASSDGNDRVIIYCEEEKAKKFLPLSMTIKGSGGTILQLQSSFGSENVKVVEKTIEK